MTARVRIRAGGDAVRVRGLRTAAANTGIASLVNAPYGRRLAIINSAARLFAPRGYSATRMDDLAESAGITKASVYYYYPSKTLILYGVLTRAAQATVRAVQPTGATSAHDELQQCTKT